MQFLKYRRVLLSVW